LKSSSTFILISLFGFYACNGPKEKPSTSDDGINSILSSENSGAIHGTEIGDEKEYVISRIKPHIVSEMPDEITARIPLSIKDSTFYDIDYDFKKEKLYSIDLDIYPNSKADCDLLFGNFKEYYNSIYGKGQEKKGFMVWYTISKTGEDVEIMMMDEPKPGLYLR